MKSIGEFESLLPTGSCSDTVVVNVANYAYNGYHFIFKIFFVAVASYPAPCGV